MLEQLASQHELPAQILAHRRLAKLKNTYVDALPPLVNPRTGRIHPTFHQLGAATGRLSATSPNVQNIPIRSEEGVRIREAFVPRRGLRAALGRLLAGRAAHPRALLGRREPDRGVPRAARTSTAARRPRWPASRRRRSRAEQRARAKAVNFGIIYGSSAFGLANQLGIASGEAQATIDAYFARYRGVRRFLDETIAAARRDGFVRTLLGRRRYLPDLASRNRALQQRRRADGREQRDPGHRGRPDQAGDGRGRRARSRPRACATRMILQVHDELVFEAPAGEVAALRRAGPRADGGGVAAAVPLVVDVGVGRELARGPLTGGIATRGDGE